MYGTVGETNEITQWFGVAKLYMQSLVSGVQSRALIFEASSACAIGERTLERIMGIQYGITRPMHMDESVSVLSLNAHNARCCRDSLV